MAFFENEKTRTVFLIRPIEFSEKISIMTETETHFVTDAAWQIIVSRWQDRAGPGVRVIEVDDNALIVMIDAEKEKMLMSKEALGS